MKKMIIVFVILSMIIPFKVYALNNTAKSVVAIDTNSGRILYEYNKDEKRLIASITKIMTAIITIENTKLSKKITAGEEILKMYGTNIYIELGEQMTVKDLLYGLLLRSGNDAAETLASNIFASKKQFISLMNKKAKEIGMKRTHFENAHGLDDDTKNYSTAYDMALLSKYASKNKIYSKIVKTKKYISSNGKKTYLWYNRNKFISMYKYATGGKNGYTPAAGKTLVTTAKKSNLNVTVVSLKDNNSYENHTNIYDYIFDKYKNYKIIDKKDFKISKNLYDGNIMIKKSFYYPLMEKEKENIKTIVSINNKKINIIGNVKIYLKNNCIGKINIYRQKENN